MKTMWCCILFVLSAATMLSAGPYYHEDFLADPFTMTPAWTKNCTGASSSAWSSSTGALWIYSPDKASQANVYSPPITGQGTAYVVTVKFMPSCVKDGSGNYISDNMVYVCAPMYDNAQRDVAIGLMYTGGQRDPKLAIRHTDTAAKGNIWYWSYYDSTEFAIEYGNYYEIKYVRQPAQESVDIYARKSTDPYWTRLKNKATNGYGFFLIGGHSASETFNRIYAGWANNASRYQVYVKEITLQVIPSLPAMCSGWYDTWESGTPARFAQAGGNFAIICAGGLATPVENYLTNAENLGVKAALDTHFMYTNPDGSVIDRFEAHPATAGWYLADEPYWHNVSLASCTTAYNVIKQHSRKPVYITFADSDFENNYPDLFKNVYDVLAYDNYPFHIGDAEFNGLEDGLQSGWKSGIDRASAKALELNKPWISVIQAFGRTSSMPDWTWRLPTRNELKFMVFYSIAKGSESIWFWSDHRRVEAIALVSEPYPYDGVQWLSDVGQPVMTELNTLAWAVSESPIPAAVSDNTDRVAEMIYQCPKTGKYYLLSVNIDPVQRSATVTIALPGSWSHLTPCAGGTNVNLVNGQATLNYGPYEVRNFELVSAPPRIPGDANGDRMVDVGDLGILAANYGGSGKSWAQGDFNGDGLVDVGDLGILAAHYGEGSTQSSSFTDDYAKAFGTTVDDGADTAEETGSSVCSSLGLPFLAGLALMGLLLVKLEE